MELQQPSSDIYMLLKNCDYTNHHEIFMQQRFFLILLRE